MTFSRFTVRDQAGLDVLAGRDQGLRRLMLVSGRLPQGDVGPVHVHDGDEVLRVVRGELLVRCGDQRRVCVEGDVVTVAPGVPHGFRALHETVIEVVAEYDIGTRYPIQTAEGGTELVEVYRPDMPWGRPPPGGQQWTTNEELAAILARLAMTSEQHRNSSMRPGVWGWRTMARGRLVFRAQRCHCLPAIEGPAAPGRAERTAGLVERLCHGAPASGIGSRRNEAWPRIPPCG